MKKYTLILFAAILMFTGCAKEEAAINYQPTGQSIEISQSSDTYFIDGVLENNAFTATQRINYVNKEQQPLSELYFHLYPNMYQNKNMVEPAYMKTMYPGGFNKGGIEVYEVSVLGVKLDTEIKDRLLKINLDNPLAPMDSLIITFKYKTSLPNSLGRMGYYNDCYNLTSFYPVAAVYDNGWQIDDYNYIGDPFFTDMADYHITLTLPENFTVAATGEYTTTSENGMKSLKIDAYNVREVAVVASPHLKMFEENVDGISVRSYAVDETYGREALSYAKDSISFYNNTFGKYPYSQISVVGSEYFGGGMEYPNIVLIAGNLYDEESKTDLEWTVAHEIAHQWWYGVVGSNPIKDPYVDESLTEFSTLIYTRSKYDENTFNQLKNQYILSPYAKYKHLVSDGKVHKNTPKFKSSLELSMLVYIKGSMMYIDMENIMGKEKLCEILKSYYEKYAYSIVSSDQLKNHIKESYEYDWDAFFNKWLYSTNV